MALTEEAGHGGGDDYPYEATVIRDLLALLAAEARQHDASVKIEHARGRWRASLLNDQGDLLAVHDRDLHSALARLWAAVGASRLGRNGNGRPNPLAATHDQVDRDF